MVHVAKPELIWPGKYNDDGTLRESARAVLPFQVIETVNARRGTRNAARPSAQPTLFDTYRGTEGDTFEDGWKNKLIWGDNRLVMESLLDRFAEKIDLIYIDPPFATGADFSFKAQIGDGSGNHFTKQQSIVEEKAYRDTWGEGLPSFLTMLHARLRIMRDLLAPHGCIFVHLDGNTSFLVRDVMNEVFGANCFCNHLVWSYKRWPGSQNVFQRMHDDILFYRKVPKHEEHRFNRQYEDVSESYLRRFGGKTQVLDPDSKTRKITIDEPTKGLPLRDVWDISIIAGVSNERTGYPTQKPEKLLQRIIETSSNEGDLVGDFFCGSGTTLAVAEKLGRRWIGCDLGRWGVHVSRKRLLDIPNCQPFEILNLGKYERQHWQGTTFSQKQHAPLTERALYEYLAFILKLYGAYPVPGMAHIHGRKGRALVHIGAVDAPVTIDDIQQALEECESVRATELHVLGWEWEMGLGGRNDLRHGGLMQRVAQERGVKLRLLYIPREVMEQQAVDRGDVHFFELAYMNVKPEKVSGKKRTIRLTLADFVIPSPELIPDDIRGLVKSWSDYIDYWAIDWNFRHDSFTQEWVAYRTRRERSLPTVSENHTYDRPGEYRILVKVVDVFGNDTSQALDVTVR